MLNESHRHRVFNFLQYHECDAAGGVTGLPRSVREACETWAIGDLCDDSGKSVGFKLPARRMVAGFLLQTAVHDRCDVNRTDAESSDVKSPLKARGRKFGYTHQ